MKKIVSLLLSIIMTFLFIPMHANAAQEDKASGQEELIAVACEAFPEYEDKILSRRSFEGSSRSTSSTRELVVTETRYISDNEAVVYSEYSDGVILLTDYTYRYSTTINSQSQEGSRTIYDVTVRATSADVANAYFELRNVQFTIYGTTYDRITNVGTYTEYGKCDVHTQCAPVLYETASTKANIVYRLSWKAYSDPGGWLPSVLRIEVGNNSFRVIHMYYDDYLESYGYLS